MSGVTISTVDGGFIASTSLNAATASTVVAIAAVAGQKIRVYKALISSGSVNQLTFLDSSTALTGAMVLSAGSFTMLPMDGQPWFTTSAGNGLNITLTSAAVISGALWFTQNSGI